MGPILALEDGTDMLSRNVGERLPRYTLRTSQKSADLICFAVEAWSQLYQLYLSKKNMPYVKWTYFLQISGAEVYHSVLLLFFFFNPDLKSWSQNTIKSSILLGLSKFAKLARSVTRSRSVLVSQFSSHLPNLKDTAKQSHLAHVSTVQRLQADIVLKQQKK